MFRGIGPIDPTAQHRNGAPLCGKRTSMGRCINPSRQSTHHGHTCAGQIMAQLFGHGTSCCGRAPSTHNSHRQSILTSQCACDVQERRRVRNHLQPRGIGRIQEAPDFNALTLNGLKFAFDAPAIRTIRPSSYRVCQLRAASILNQLIAGSAQNSIGGTPGAN
jgi:hypothetical protein